ncbi:MAG: hypothetical protein HY027_04090 [Deltaproteobacteria bacterium]|nr:hypothetical protein [Deltaproteobacteria bacterium]
MTRRRALATGAGLIVWSVLWFAPWQPALQPWPWARAAVGVALWLALGVGLHALITREASRWSARLGYGWALSAMLTGLVGLPACLLHVSFAAVMATLWAAGVLGLLLLASTDRESLGAPRRVDWPGAVPLLPALLVLLVAARLAFVPAGGDDKFTQVARVTSFLQADALGFHSIGFGEAVTVPPRYWLAYWSLGEAVMAALSGLHPLELATNYLAAFLAPLSFIAVFELAMSLGFSRRLAVLAMLGQLAGLLALLGGRQAGFIFLLRLPEDKVMGAFVLAPICLAAAASYFEAPTPRRLVLAGMVFLGLAFVHPTSFGIACMITVAYAAAEATMPRARARAARLVAMVALVAAVFSVPRFVDHPARTHTHFTVASARAAGELQQHRRAKLHISTDARRFAVPAAIVPLRIQLAGLAVLGVALLRLRRDRAARYVAAALVVIGLTFFGATAWILALAITPFHLWRVAWQGPFGVGLTLLLRPLVYRASPRLQRPALVTAGEIIFLAALLFVALPSWRAVRLFRVPSDWRSVLYTEDELLRKRPSCRRTYADLIAIGRFIDARAPHGAIVVGDFPDTNNLLPSVSTQARLLVFRQPIETAQHASIALAEATRRQTELERVFAADTSAVERLRILSDYRVDLVLHCGKWPAADQLATEYPEAFRLEATAGDFQLYRLGREARPG